MASSGTISNTFRTGYAIRIVWSTTAQSVADNTSTVTASVQLVSLGASYTIVSSASKTGTLTINGISYAFSFNASLSGNQTKTLYTKSVKIAHNADGSKTCAFSCSAGIQVTLSGTYYDSVSATGSGVFDTIARASTISSITASVEVNGTNTVGIGIARASSTFTHTVKITFGSYSQTITGVTTATSYAIPVSWLNAMPNATSGIATATLTTYSGSTQVGNSTIKTFTLTVPSSVVPSITSVSLIESVSGLNAQFGGYVQNKSKIAATIASSGIYSSTIRSYKTTLEGNTYTGASFTSAVLTSSGSLTLNITVTDSRGRTASTTRTITVIPYDIPTISRFKAYRSDSAGNPINNGAYVAADVKFSISAVNSLNTKSYKVEYKAKSSNTWNELATGSVYTYDNVMVFSGISTDNSYDIRLTVSDYFTSAEKTVDIPTDFTLIDFNSSGKGLAFGKVSEKSNAMEINMDIYDKHGTLIRNGLTYYLSGGAIDADTTTEELVLTTTNTPIAGTFFYIRTMFYSAKSETANRTQVAYPYSIVKSTYYRYYINGTGWSNWIENPVISESGTSGIWTYRKYTDGTAECFGKINVSAADVNTALGGWYRGTNLYAATDYPYPVTFSEAPAVEMMFQTRNSSSALLWTFSSSAENARLYLPQCYLIRPVTGTGLAGNVNVYARGRI